MTASHPAFIQPSFEEQGPRSRALQPMYAALVREFVIEVSACPVNSDEEFSCFARVASKQAEAWFQQVDAQIQVHQLRQFLQTTPLANEAVLRHLLLHHMQKAVEIRQRPRQNGFPAGPVFFAVRALGPGGRRRGPRLRRAGAGAGARAATAEASRNG